MSTSLSCGALSLHLIHCSTKTKRKGNMKQIKNYVNDLLFNLITITKKLTIRKKKNLKTGLLPWKVLFINLSAIGLAKILVSYCIY